VAVDLVLCPDYILVDVLEHAHNNIVIARVLFTKSLDDRNDYATQSTNKSTKENSGPSIHGVMRPW